MHVPTTLAPMPHVLRVTSLQCDDCANMGYDPEDGSVCEPCHGRGAIPVAIVACPVHGVAVARSGFGGLLGACDGCAAEAARALLLLSGKSTGDRGSVLGESATVARRSTV